MIKLKLSKDHLQMACTFTKPNYFERKGVDLVEENEYMIACNAFNLMAIGERAAKLFLFGHKKKYTLSLTLSEACSLLNHMLNICNNPKDTYHLHVAELIKISIHADLTNYQLRYA